MVQWSTLGLLLVQLYHYWLFIGFIIDGLLINGLLEEISPVPWKLRPFPLILLIRKSANAPLVTLVSSGLLHYTYSKAVTYTQTPCFTMFYTKKTCSCWACASALCGLQDSSFPGGRLYWTPGRRREAARLIAGRGWKMETWRCVVAKAVTCKSGWWRDVKCWYVLIIAGR